jgi:hypothetical protein
MDALPFYGRCLHPQPEPKPARFEKGARVVWIPDHDEGEVTGVIPGLAVASAWDSTRRVEWYAMCSGAMDRIATLNRQEVV